MLLLDHNLPAQLKAIFTSHGFTCATTYEHGWQELENGDLVAKASNAGFTCIVTKDVRFGLAAARALKTHPNMAVILIRLPQGKSADYTARVEARMQSNPLVPTPGKIIEWP